MSRPIDSSTWKTGRTNPIPGRRGTRPGQGALRVLCVGAGFSGAVIARALAEAGHRATVIDQRPHPAGNCHTERDRETGIMVHAYGPHIFHTDDAAIWAYANRFARFEPFVNRVKTTINGQVYSLPINLHTINQFFGKTLDPAGARAFLAAQADTTLTDPQNFEDQALSLIGPDLYRSFFEGYTRKQWGCCPRELPASILKRLPIRFSYDDNYFSHRFQGIPRDGYTAMVSAILDHPNIDLHLNTPYRAKMAGRHDHVVWSGPLDEYFDHRLGRLGYRTLRFEKLRGTGDWQGCAVMNYGDPDTPWTRVTEHKHFAPWESHDDTICFREYSRACGPGDTPFYPIRLVQEKAMLAQYMALARQTEGVSFVGRLGTYRYLDMDVTIREALEVAETLLATTARNRPAPVFAHPPL